MLTNSLVAMLIFTACAAAQPTINYIVSAASFDSTALAAGGLGTILGSKFSDASYSASGLPWPTVLGKTTVAVCYDGATCVSPQLTYVGPTQINFLLPSCGVGADGNTPGFCSGTLTVLDGAFSSKPSPLRALSFDPDMFIVGYDCWIDPTFPSPIVARAPRCGLSSAPAPPGYNGVDLLQATRAAITDTSGNVVYSGNPARLGQYYTIWLTGVEYSQGQATPSVNVGLSNVPICCDPAITTIIFSVPLSYVGPSEFPGLSQINFQLPLSLATGNGTVYDSPFPCGSYKWEIVVEVSQGNWPSSLRFVPTLPVAVDPGDVPCS